MLKVYTDGAYSPNRNNGGWAFVVTENGKKIHSNFYSVFDTTNNRMEITACIEAIEWLIDQGINEAEILTDSMYVIGTMTKNWKRNKNHDLWKILDKLVSNVSLIWTHVKGHSGDKFNSYCDNLASGATFIT